jgi:hypothetical protein
VLGHSDGWLARRRRHRDERGVVAIEAALIFPILITLALGIIEWSLVLRDQLEVTSLARAGARNASTLAPTHPWVAPPTPFTRQVVDSIERAASVLPRGSVQYVLVYQAGPDGRPLSGTFNCGSVDTTCDRYDWDPTANGGLGDWVRTPGANWTGATINACLGEAGMMDVGVFVQANHRMLTGLFGSNRTLRSYTAMRFEPRPPGRCKP